MVAYVGGEKQIGHVYAASGSTSWRGTVSGGRVARAFPFPLELEEVSETLSLSAGGEGAGLADSAAEPSADLLPSGAGVTSNSESLPAMVLCESGGGEAATVLCD